MIDEALGAVSTFNDLNKDGAIDVADVQIVANAPLSLPRAAK